MTNFLSLNRLLDALTISHLRSTDVSLNAELALHAIDDNFQVQLAHSRDNRLPGLFVTTHTERRIFLRKTPQRDTHFFLVGFRLRLNRDVNHGLWKLHTPERDHRSRIAERLARCHFFQPDTSGDVAGQNLFDFFAIVGAHLEHTPDTLLAPFNRVVNRITGLKNP